MLQLQGVSKTYGHAAAMHPTELALPAGLTTVLIGPSGCSKSELLRPDTGAVVFDGAPLTADNVLRFRQRMTTSSRTAGSSPVSPPATTSPLWPITSAGKPAASPDASTSCPG